MREAAKRIMYHTVTSNAMNSYSSTTRVISVTPPWEIAVIATDITLGVLLGASCVWFIATTVKDLINKRRQENN